MKMYHERGYYHRKAIYLLGCLTAIVICFTAFMACYISIGRAITNRPVNKGYITGKAYNDGREREELWCCGKYALSIKRGGEAYFYVIVSDGKRDDIWKVSHEDWSKANIGDYVYRDKLQQGHS